MQGDQCLLCIHYRGEAECTAYPDGIPYEVISGDHDHTKPYKDDHGIRFEARRQGRKVSK